MRSALAYLFVFAALSAAAAPAPLTLHVIVQSHLDPVWLWDRGAGTDAAIATLRTCCDVLDAYPEVHIARGESWVYETVERCDPATFARVKRLVAEGRLHVVGGTYVQPDVSPATGTRPFRKRISSSSRIKREVRKTEEALARGAGLLSSEYLEDAWKKVLFADFHDIYGGACIESAYEDIYDGLAAVRSVGAVC